ncbi:hypothetical protein TNIN_319871 [Trichonephila inaurata madagascariensis]|uniref:SWIM-type domain-containing protein n=1 Tax=Trichonephila inaurata madagascariensis TaxID=2747483 RepID=A0A8X6XL48_9ARAC|nr:hypothetical protein TNIN_319871 [Trichonephila inaurata madagascariensis]
MPAVVCSKKVPIDHGNSAKCTCPAGGAPTFCKHVFAILYALEDYSSKEMYTTSTERLQTWHQSKPSKACPCVCVFQSNFWQIPDNFNLPYTGQQGCNKTQP